MTNVELGMIVYDLILELELAEQNAKRHIIVGQLRNELGKLIEEAE